MCFSGRDSTADAARGRCPGWGHQRRHASMIVTSERDEYRFLDRLRRRAGHVETDEVRRISHEVAQSIRDTHFSAAP